MYSYVLFGEKLRALREENNYSRQTLYEKSGISVSTIERIEKAITILKLDTLELLSYVLNINLWFRL